MPRGRNRRSRKEDAHDRGPGQPARHAATARDHEKAEAYGQRGDDANLQGPGRGVRLLGLLVRADVFSENRSARLGYRPSRKSIRRMVENIHALTARSGTWQET